MSSNVKDIFKEIFGNPVGEIEKIISDLKGKPVDFVDLEIDGINHKDSPDFVDAFIASATAVTPDGSLREATEEELEELNRDRDRVYALVLKKIY